MWHLGLQDRIETSKSAAKKLPRCFVPRRQGETEHLLSSKRQMLPSGKQTVCYWKWPSRNSGFSHWKWCFSIIMLVYQRVQVPVASLLGRFFPVLPWVSISGSDCGVGCKPLKIAMEAQWNPGTWNLYCCWVAKLGQYITYSSTISHNFPLYYDRLNPI